MSSYEVCIYEFGSNKYYISNTVRHRLELKRIFSPLRT